MGHRATYAIRENGKVSLYYSHWGALTVPEDVFWGPRFAEAFVRSNEHSDEWLDTTFAEGGIAMCKDTKRCAFFGGDRVGLGPEHELFVSLMRTLWKGWSIEWVDDLRGVAECVGVAEDEVLAPFYPPIPFPAEKMHVTNPLTLVVFREASETRAIGMPGMPPGLLAHGDALLDMLSDAREIRPDDSLLFFMEIDCDARHIRFRGYSGGRLLEWLGERWPGWTFAETKTSPHELAKELGVPSSAIPEPSPTGTASRADQVETIAAALFGTREDPAVFASQVLAGFVDAERAEASELFINPSALSSPVDARPDEETASELFAEALAANP